MDIQFDEWNTYLNLRTGEVISVTQGDLRAAEEDEPYDDLPDWQQEARELAIDIFENYDDYEELPTKFDINEYDIMEDYCYSIENQKTRSLLLNAIQGRGAFRRFKDKIHELGIEEKWYAYRDARLREIAIEWCEDHGIEYIE